MSRTAEGMALAGWFLLWIIPGLLLPAGLLVLPFGVLLFWPVAAVVGYVLIRTRRPVGPEVLGSLVGVAVWAFAVAYFNWNAVPCASAPPTASECHGTAPGPFLVAGIGLILLALVGATVWSVLVVRNRGVERDARRHES